VGSLKHKKNNEEEIYHNKVYLFNSQTMENNIKKLKESLMQKTQFLQKHETIDNIKKETKHNLVKSRNDLMNKRKHKKQNSSFSNEKKNENYPNKSNSNSDFSINENDTSNLNNNYDKNKNENEEIFKQNKNENDENNENYENNNENKKKFNKEKSRNKETYSNNSREISNEIRTGDSGVKQIKKSNDNKENTLDSIKNSYKQKAEKARFLTSLDQTEPNNKNIDSYFQSAQKKLQKFSNKISIKSRNMINAGTMNGNSDYENSNLIHNKSINNTLSNNINLDASRPNNFCPNSKIQNFDIKDKINQSFNFNEDAQRKEIDYLHKNIEKSKNSKQNSLNQKKFKDKNSFNFSKSDSDLKLQEGEILNNLNLLENHKNNYKNNNKDLEVKNYFNAMETETEEKNTNTNDKKYKEINELKKTKNLNANKLTPLNRNLKEIDLSNSLNTLENAESNGYSKSPINNRKLTNDQLFSSTKYLLSNPNLITNTEINANLQSKIKFYNTQNNIRKFTAPEADENFVIYKKKKSKNSMFKKLENKDTIIFINENYSDSMNSQTLGSNKQYGQVSYEAKSKIEKEINISSYLLNKNNESNYDDFNDNNQNLSSLNNNKKKITEELNHSQINKWKNSTKEKLDHKNFKRLNSNITNISKQGTMKQNTSEFERNVNAKSILKIKITDRVALMSKGILKETYDAETEKIFSKMFTKNLEPILEMKKYPIRAAATEKVNIHDERYEFGKRNYISKEITDLKEKVYFLKGTLDYIFPQFLIGKLKETVKKQKVSNNRIMLNTITEKNLNFNDSVIKDNNFNNKGISNINNNLLKLDNSKSFIQNKDSEILIIENTDKCSSNGNSKNEFFFPNINLKNNQTNNNNNNNNSCFENFKNMDLNREINQVRNGSKKKDGRIISNFRSVSFNNRYNLSNLYKTKLISPETNSSLFNRFNNFKNLGKNTTSGNTNNVFWNNSMLETNLKNQKKLIRKQIVTKTLSIQNMNSFNYNQEFLI
jgi:hypothetical protein